MKGSIRCKDTRCPSCGKPFTHVRRVGFGCPDCQTTPKRFYVELWHQGKRFRIYSDDKGQALDSYQRASTLQARLDYEIQNHLFDPSHYLKREAQEFWISSLLDKFLEVKEGGIAPSYKGTYRKIIEIAKAYFGPQNVREVRKVHLVNYLRHLESLPGDPHPQGAQASLARLGAKTRKNYLDVFKVFLNWCRSDLEIISLVPSFPKVEYERRPAPRWIESTDRQDLLGFVPAGDMEIFRFMMLHPLRPGEVRALRCKCVDLRTGRLTILGTFSKNIYRERRKGRSAEPSVIPIHSECLSYIAERVRTNLPEAYLFTNPRSGQPYSESAVRRAWDGVKRRAEVQGLRLYDCTRHSIASELISKGSPLYNVSKLLGHSSVRTTEKYYAHLKVDSLRVDLEKLSLKKVLTAPTPPPDKSGIAEKKGTSSG